MPTRCLSRSRRRFHGVNTHEAQGATSGAAGTQDRCGERPLTGGSRLAESGEVSPILLTVLPGRSRGGAWKACLTHSQAPKGGAERPVKSKMNARKGPSHTDASSRKQLSLCAVIGPEPGAFWSM